MVAGRPELSATVAQVGLVLIVHPAVTSERLRRSAEGLPLSMRVGSDADQGSPAGSGRPEPAFPRADERRPAFPGGTGAPDTGNGRRTLGQLIATLESQVYASVLPKWPGKIDHRGNHQGKKGDYAFTL